MPTSLLEVRDLRTVFHTREAVIHAVNSVSFDLRQGEILGVVGESGSGKSVSMLSVMGLLPSPPAVVSGSIRVEGGRPLVPDGIHAAIRVQRNSQ